MSDQLPLAGASAQVKLRRTQYEQISSGLPLKADITQYSRHLSKVPTAEDRRLQRAGPHSTHPRGGVNLSVQCAQHFSCGNEVDDFVFGVECVDDGAEAQLTHLRMPLTCED
jgi:hypothetical protein